MSKNFFAALDDSGDEAEVAKVKVTTKKEPKKPASKPAAVEPAKSERRRPNNNDRNTKQGRGRGPARDGKRTYDRRSGTGRGKEIKKGGGGARNWGNDKNEARKAEGTVIEGAVDAKPEETTTPTATTDVETPTGDETAEAPATTTTTEPEEVKEVEEEDKTMTYEDYLKSKQAPDTDAFKPVAERQLVNEFEGKAVQKAVEEDFLVMGGGKALRKKGTKKGDKKSTLDVGFRVSTGDEPRRNNDRRGNDRRGRGGGGRGAAGGRTGGRGGKGGRQGGAINVTDVNAHPSL